uniref:Methyltransferase-like protein 5 n=1 Tax=Setaria digitata TaxID=48799 RepID=A0A915PPC8_9BILA
MRKKHFEWFLSQIETFRNLNVQLEQYSTNVELAEAILNAIAENGCLEGCTVADLGCGPGILLLGAVKLGASYGLGVEIDEEAVDICQRNIVRCELKNSVDVICLDVTKNITALKPIFDTVIMNPPFGTKNNTGADLRFVEAGLSILKKGGTLFSLHKSSTRQYISKFAARKLPDVIGECIAKLRWNLPATYAYHRRQSIDIDVDLWQFSNNS